jgi:hypothetical protein
MVRELGKLKTQTGRQNKVARQLSSDIRTLQLRALGVRSVYEPAIEEEIERCETTEYPGWLESVRSSPAGPVDQVGAVSAELLALIRIVAAKRDQGLRVLTCRRAHSADSACHAR